MCVSFKPTKVGGDFVKDCLAVVPERRMSKVVGQRGRINDVGVASERLSQLAGNLGNFERVCQPVANEVVGSRA